jgi:hypothetical protein
MILKTLFFFRLMLIVNLCILLKILHLVGGLKKQLLKLDFLIEIFIVV